MPCVGWFTPFSRDGFEVQGRSALGVVWFDGSSSWDSKEVRAKCVLGRVGGCLEMHPLQSVVLQFMAWIYNFLIHHSLGDKLAHATNVDGVITFGKRSGCAKPFLTPQRAGAPVSQTVERPRHQQSHLESFLKSHDSK